MMSCASSDNEDADKNSAPKGVFVNQSLLNQLRIGIPGSSAFYCTLVDFYSADSARIENGIEVFNLAYKKEGDHYLLLEASNKGNMPFVLNENGSLTLIDTAWTELKVPSEFKNVSDSAHKNFEYVLNQLLIAGKYNAASKNVLLRDEVLFSADGKVSGISDYSSYSICYNGDCVGMSMPASNIISFQNSNGAGEDFAFTFDAKNHSLKIYQLAAPSDDIKGEREIEKLLFDLIKQKHGAGN